MEIAAFACNVGFSSCSVTWLVDANAAPPVPPPPAPPPGRRRRSRARGRDAGGSQGRGTDVKIKSLGGVTT